MSAYEFFSSCLHVSASQVSVSILASPQVVVVLPLDVLFLVPMGPEGKEAKKTLSIVPWIQLAKQYSIKLIMKYLCHDI